MSVIGILGTIHDDDLRKTINYPLSLIRDVIIKFAPDIICGEVRPEDWKQYQKNKFYTGYLGPSEYRKTIIPLCEQTGITFHPTDFFKDEHIRMNHFAPFSQEEQSKLVSVLMEKYEYMFKTTEKDSIPFNSDQLNCLIEKKQEWLRQINPEVQSIIWDQRNEEMINNIRNIVNENQGKKILITVGAEHSYVFIKALKQSNNEIVFPLHID